jgi:hypothetical protein
MNIEQGSYIFVPVADTIQMIFRGLVLAATALWCLEKPPMAQPVITSGPNYCCWSIGEVQQALTASGANGTYTWSLASGSLPPGVSLRTDVPGNFRRARAQG